MEISSKHAKKRRNFGNQVIEIYGWLRIVGSPLLVGVAIGLGIYFNFPNTNGLIAAILIVTIGLIVGIIWATRVWKKEGTMNFISKISESPDLDYLDEDNNNETVSSQK